MPPFGRILLCYDASPEGQHALRCGAILARQMQAETHLLAILDYSCWSNGFAALAPLGLDVDEQTAREILSEGVAKLRAWGVTATGHFLVGSPIDHISQLAHSLKVDLIVIGHRHEGFFARLCTGENHAALLERVSCGVLFEVSE